MCALNLNLESVFLSQCVSVLVGSALSVLVRGRSVYRRDVFRAGTV